MSVISIGEKVFRKSFGRIASVAEIPNLIEVQKLSYDSFLQIDKAPDKRENVGLESVFRSVFPIDDGQATLEYCGYELEEPKYTVEECIKRSNNYAAPLKVKLMLVVSDVDEETGAREVRSIKEQSVYMGEVPLMTERGTFIINGAERVIVSQMHRAPGAFYYDDGGKKHVSGKRQHSARIIPYRGSWLDIEFDVKDLMYFRIDRKRKLYVTTLLRALGYDKEGILKEFYDNLLLQRRKDKWVSKFDIERFKGLKVYYDVVDAATGEVIIEAESKVTPRLVKKLNEYEGERHYIVPRDEIIGRFMAEYIESKDGLSIAESGDSITEEILEQLEEQGIKEFRVLDIDFVRVGPYIRNTLVLDKNLSQDEALADIYRVLRPGEPSTPEVALAVFNSLFFDKDRYDLSVIGRMKINMKHGIKASEDQTVLSKEDIIAIVKHLLDIKNGLGQVDDIDNLGNRRVRSVGELFENQMRLGLVRMVRSILERMASVEIDTVMPYELVNAKILMALVREFFGRSQLSQFMDQTNPLAEVTHKRRVSAFGPGGVTRERAGYEMRDVHPTHYGRICPIETPEGANIGLINSLACYSQINKYGFIESPYRKVENGKVTDEVIYLSAIEEAKYIIAQANSKLDANGQFIEEMITCHQAGEPILASPEKIQFIDVSPKQLVSVAASLIPFLENDDANRALMGSNMQRQAVPLIKSEAPFVGTGMESVVARDSGATVVAKRSGVVDQVDAHRIVIRTEEPNDDAPGVDIYTLVKFQKSNQGTCINQRPIVKVGDVVATGEIIADGPSTENGELALGRNVLVAFMPWNGYNFEDSILLSEKVSREDIFTSIHIQEFEVIARDTRLGPEEITRDIPNIGEESLRHLDEVGVVHIGAQVKAGDILVGKVTPKSEAPITAEEKLLRAIFGEKAADVKDSSLRLPPGVEGTVVEVCSFTRRGIEKDERTVAQERREIEYLAQDKDDELEIINSHTYSRLSEMLLSKTLVSGPKSFKPNTAITEAALNATPRKQWWQIVVKDAKVMAEVERIKTVFDKCVAQIEQDFKSKIEKVQSGDDLPQGALKVVKVFVATKLKIQPGDKIAGRHGNKGVISKIVPIEDMPFLDDGTPVDIVLNPLGVPSRMNVGQILETHLGWAAVNLGKQIDESLKAARKSGKYKELREKLEALYNDGRNPELLKAMKNKDDASIDTIGEHLSKGVPMATPVFDGIAEQEMNEMLRLAGVDVSGQVDLIDGRTGLPFERKVTVGYIYMLKLDHLVSDKIHARSTGPYSLVTQQPLGGKSHFGGQRFGEMECWALQGYGAAYTLQEMLTVKSDDVNGRVKMYESIVQGNTAFDSGIPESFNVIIKELRSLCLNIEMCEEEE